MRVPIKGYEKYEVSDEGIIYNAKGQALVGFNVLNVQIKGVRLWLNS